MLLKRMVTEALWSITTGNAHFPEGAATVKVIDDLQGWDGRIKAWVSPGKDLDPSRFLGASVEERSVRGMIPCPISAPNGLVDTGAGRAAVAPANIGGRCAGRHPSSNDSFVVPKV
jgi:hypothetical protein